MRNKPLPGMMKNSPMKQKGDNLKRIMTENKKFKKATGTYYAPGAEPKPKVGTSKGFNWTGSKEAKKSRILTKQERTANFRAEGRKTPTVRSTQVDRSGKVRVTEKKISKSSTSDKVLHKNLNKIADRYKTKTKKKVVKKSIGKTILKGAGKIAKVAAKRAGPIGAVMTAYEIGKTIPKISKSTVKGLKKKAKSGNVNIGRKL